MYTLMEITNWWWYRTWRWGVTSLLFIFCYRWFIVRPRTMIGISSEIVWDEEKATKTPSIHHFSLDEWLKQRENIYANIEHYHAHKSVQALYGLCIGQLSWVYHHSYEELTLNELIQLDTYPTHYKELLARMYHGIYQSTHYSTKNIQDLALELKDIVLATTPQSWELPSEN